MQGLRRSNSPAILLLEDGTVFEGKALGAQGTSVGEIAFNTGMYGYQEIFTDPSYHKQMLVMATPHIGNYGVHEIEVESDGIKVAGIVVRNFSTIASRVGGSGTLQDNLEASGTVGISDVDTRALVRHIRMNGAMNCILSTEEFDVEKLKSQLSEVPSMEGLALSKEVSVTEAYDFNEIKDGHRIALLDLGLKRSIASCLAERGCDIRVFPWDSKAEDLLAWNPDGIMLSNGPGDPSAMPNVKEEVAKLVDSGLPVFGICLGHQLLSLSQGLQTEKMHNGHRGVNHPVKNLMTGTCEITSQNHGFVVSHESLEQNTDVELTHIHLNDDTVAGIRLKGRPVFSVQYHPEASAGPHDSRYLFDDFVSLIEEYKKVTA
ncbi:MAG: carbamoyl phosphate synthase small subunit [Euryarchaeota archaeon]|nr:carbamoyl phosphate synthase small subunit [Euryarchaeota archaeon]|tara:strand:+ start:238 stop:1362 length:1125 start_codon:yes stop_codon:yes gene_type:complete